jgi:hypothetical protein
LNPSDSPRIFARHSSNQLPHLRVNSGTARPRPRPRAPIQSEFFPMPANHGLWLDDDEDASPARPTSEQGDPESPISRIQSRTRLFVGVGGELLTQGQFDDSLLSTSAQQGRQTGNENRCVGDEDPSHRRILKVRAREIEPESGRTSLVVSWGGDSALLGSGRILRTHRQSCRRTAISSRSDLICSARLIDGLPIDMRGARRREENRFASNCSAPGREPSRSVGAWLSERLMSVVRKRPLRCLIPLRRRGRYRALSIGAEGVNRIGSVARPATFPA